MGHLEIPIRRLHSLTIGGVDVTDDVVSAEFVEQVDGLPVVRESLRPEADD